MFIFYIKSVCVYRYFSKLSFYVHSVLSLSSFRSFTYITYLANRY